MSAELTQDDLAVLKDISQVKFVDIYTNGESAERVGAEWIEHDTTGLL